MDVLSDRGSTPLVSTIEKTLILVLNQGLFLCFYGILQHFRNLFLLFSFGLIIEITHF